MRTTLRTTAVAALCALALTATSALAAGKERLHHERATIKSIDAAQHQLVVTDLKNNTDRTFQWNDQTRFMEHGKVIASDELKSGEHVSLSYRGDSSTLERVIVNPMRHSTKGTHETSPQS